MVNNESKYILQRRIIALSWPCILGCNYDSGHGGACAPGGYGIHCSVRPWCGAVQMAAGGAGERGGVRKGSPAGESAVSQG